jgi:hypothetical protein
MFSPLKLHDLEASNTPALIMELEMQNDAKQAVEVGFFAALPAFVERNSVRELAEVLEGEEGAVHAEHGGWEACRHACFVSPLCGAWSVNGTGPCKLGRLNSSGIGDPELHTKGGWSGVDGSWDYVPVPTVPRNPKVEGVAFNKALVARRKLGLNYYSGSQCLYPVPSSGGYSSSDIDDSLLSLWQRFAHTGQPPSTDEYGSSNSTSGQEGQEGGYGSGQEGQEGGYGATSVMQRIGAGERGVLRVVFAWHHPNRYHFGSLLGNEYSTRFKDALDVATQVVHGPSTMLRKKFSAKGATVAGTVDNATSATPRSSNSEGRDSKNSSTDSIATIVQNIQHWHDTVLENDLPLDIRDFLVSAQLVLRSQCTTPFTHHAFLLVSAELG